MIRSFAYLWACLLMMAVLLPGVSRAQDQQPPDQDALVAEFIDLMYERHRGFLASEAVLAQSFAAHLHGDADPQTVADLSALYAAYDPQSGSGATAGMLAYHLARPVAILRELGGGPNEVFAQIVEIRLRWLAGRADLALEQAVHLIGLMDQEGMGWENTDMVSLLADAAVLSWRAGEVEAAEGYFARARECGERRCPTDSIFDWLGDKRKDSSDRFAGYNAQVMADVARGWTAALLPDHPEVAEEIALEHDLMSGAGGRVLQSALTTALATPDPQALTPEDRRAFGRLAPRVAGRLDFASYLMGSKSAAGQARLNAMTGGELGEPDVDDIGYLETTFDDMLLKTVPLLYAVLRVSDRRGDPELAELLRIRLILAAGELDRGLADLQALYARSSSAGFSDTELFSVLMDMLVVARITGQEEVEARAAAATETCRTVPCFDDLALNLLVRQSDDLPRMPTPGNMVKLRQQAADAFMRKVFPGDMLKLADIYKTGASQSRPMDAARNDALSLSLAEQAAEIAPEDLARRAASVMDTLIYAGLYADALATGDRISSRLEREGAAEALTERFFRVRARAAFRVDDPRARAFYARAVELGWSEDLVLDLLDTSYLDLLDQLIAQGGAEASVVARLRHRQGRHAEAANVLRAERRRLETAALGDHMQGFFNTRAAQHLRGGNLDAHVAETLNAQAAADGEVPADHHFIYSRYWDLMVLAWQEAVYAEAGGDLERARRLRDLGGHPSWFHADWPPLGDRPDPAAIARFERRETKSDDSYDLIRSVIDMRDNGNYEGAAQYLKSKRWVAIAAEANGAYVDAQALWQMAFTFARAGETGIAFDLMNRAARIAARLSFEGAGGADGGTLQLLERDRWRYLLFVDIAWAAVSGQAPQDMLVVSRY